MSGRQRNTNVWDDHLSDSDDPHDSDVDDSEGEETIECPACGRDIYEGAEQCPRCGQYLSEEEGQQRGGTPIWIWVGIILALLGTVAWIF